MDDRFTSYSYAASDKKIKNVLNNLELEAGTDIDNDKPDLSVFFSHNPSDKKGLKAVLIELKSFKDEGKSDREKFHSIQQLIDYIKAFQSKEEIKEVWAFLVTDMGDKLSERLIDNGYTPMFSTERPIYSKYYNNLRAFIHVVGVETLILDAEARNKVFIDIINKQSRLNKYLSPEKEKAKSE